MTWPSAGTRASLELTASYSAYRGITGRPAHPSPAAPRPSYALELHKNSSSCQQQLPPRTLSRPSQGEGS